MAIELGVLLGIAVLGTAGFAVFEVETPWWRKVLKWALVSASTLLLYAAVGHWAVVLPVAAALAGTTFHFWWCRKHGIHPLHATPRKRYYALRGWEWKE